MLAAPKLLSQVVSNKIKLNSHLRTRNNRFLAETKRWIVEHTISLSWRIGRAVAKARKFNRIDSVAESIIDEVGAMKPPRSYSKEKLLELNGHSEWGTSMERS